MTIPPLILQWRDRALAWRPVLRLRTIVAAYNEAGGGLLAAGLAYGALFATLTALLFVLGVVGFVVHDPTTREAIVQAIADQLPPIEPMVRGGLLKASANAGAVSIVGIATLAWSASQFYGSLDAAFARIFKMAPERALVERILRGLLSVLVVTAALVGAVAVASVQAIVMRDLPSGPAGESLRIVALVGYSVLTVVVVVLAVGLLYRVVPNTHVPWRAIAPPALVAGIALAALTELFVFLAPRLVGSLAVFGGVVAVFAAMIWLHWAFQAVLIGAAWVRARVSDDVVGPMPLGEGRGGA